MWILLKVSEIHQPKIIKIDNINKVTFLPGSYRNKIFMKGPHGILTHFYKSGKNDQILSLYTLPIKNCAMNDRVVRPFLIMYIWP